MHCPEHRGDPQVLRRIFGLGTCSIFAHQSDCVKWLSFECGKSSKPTPAFVFPSCVLGPRTVPADVSPTRGRFLERWIVARCANATLSPSRRSSESNDGAGRRIVGSWLSVRRVMVDQLRVIGGLVNRAGSGGVGERRTQAQGATSPKQLAGCSRCDRFDGRR